MADHNHDVFDQQISDDELKDLDHWVFVIIEQLETERRAQQASIDSNEEEQA